MNLDEIKKLIRLVEKSKISELEVEEKGKKIRIAKAQGETVSVQGTPSTTQGQQPAPVPDAPKPKPEVEEDKYHDIKCPMVGTFYRAPAEDAEPFVNKGDTVDKGQTICVVEAMKLMNEIESDIKGRIIQIIPENGSAVEYGEVLFKIEPV